MHEMSCVLRLVSAAERAAAEHPGQRVRTVVVTVGEMTGYLPEYIEKYYPEAIRGTGLSGSSLEIRYKKAEVVCADCGEHYFPKDVPDMRCPACGSIAARILHGRELSLTELVLEDVSAD